MQEDKKTVEAEGKDLVSAIATAAEALGVDPGNVGYKLDLSHFRSSATGGMKPARTVKVIGWVEEGGTDIGSIKASDEQKAERGEREDRPERGERRDRGDRGDRRDRGDRGDRRGKDRGDRGDRGDRRDRGERRDRGDREDREDRGERVAKEAPTGTTEASELAKAWFQALLGHMGVEGTVEATGNETDIRLDVTAERAGRIIGKRGTTLRAIRFFLRRLLADHGDPELEVEVEDPRPREQKDEERKSRGPKGGGKGRGGDRGDRGGREKSGYPEEKLRALARRAAEKAIETGKTITINLELSSYDRRIVHMEVAEVDGAASQSEEKDGVKYVQVSPA